MRELSMSSEDEAYPPIWASVGIGTLASLIRS